MKYIEKVIQTCGTHTLIVPVILYTICDKSSVSYLDLHLEIDNGGRLKTKLYDKHLGFTFPIVNSPFISSNILASPAHGVCISQLICYSRACGQSSNLLDRAQLLTKRLLKQGFVAPRLKSLLQKLYGLHHNLLDIHISKDNGSSTFYIDVLFPLSLPIFLLDLTVCMSNTVGAL